MAQLARAPALQAGGRGFEPHILHTRGRKMPRRFIDRMGERRKQDTRLTYNNERTRHTRDTRARAAGCGPEQEDTERRRGPRAERLGGERANKGARGMPVAPRGEEGRGRQRNAAGRREQPWIRGCPNGETRRAEARHPQIAEANPANRNIQVAGGKENNSDPPSSGERKGASPNPGRRGAPGVVGPASRTKSA